MANDESLPTAPQKARPPFGFSGGGASRILSLAERQAQIDADMERIRAKALRPAKPGERPDGPDGMVIHQPIMFIAAIDRQLKALQLGLNVGQEVYDLERVRTYLSELSSLVSQKIAKMDPAVHAELMDEMRKLNEAYLVGDGDKT